LSGSKLLAGFASLIGAWIAVSPFVYRNVAETGLGAGGWNNLIVGAAIFLVAGTNFYRVQKGINVSKIAAALVALLGLWLIVGPLSSFSMDVGMFSSTLVSGLLVAAIGAYNAYKGRQAERAGAAARTV
jgi:ABC-type nickel/cobalt efflux system permease component RcnA